jgi:HD-like signal output (HDOD) protein
MQVYDQTQPSTHRAVDGASPERVKKRKERLLSILTKGLPALPDLVMEINTMLSSGSVDLKRVGKRIRNDPSLSAQLLRLCNSAAFGMRRRVLSIEEAAVLMGSERLRTLVLTCSIMEFSGKQLPRADMQTYWEHSFLTGMLSERIARWAEYSECEQAYLAGLLHDIGALPLLLVANEEKALSGKNNGGPWGGSLETEIAFFGMSHCEVGRKIGESWNFFPSFIDVFQHHHDPGTSSRDPHLVGIVAAADHFCEMRAEFPAPAESSTVLVEDDTGEVDEFLKKCFPRFGADERSELLEMLETEYLHLLPMIALNHPSGDPAAEK